MPEVAFVISPRQPYPLRELVATLRYELGKQGIPCSEHAGFPEPRPDRVFALVSPREYVALEGEPALPDETVLKRTVFLCAEPPDSLVEGGHVDLLRRAGTVFELDQRAVVALHRLGVRARLLKPGYSESLDHFDPERARPIDVMFLGAHTRRRARYLSRAGRVLARHNCLLQLADHVPSSGDSSSFLAQGRWPLLAQTKVVINLHCGDATHLEWRRVLDAIHAGAVVVSEHSTGLAPLVAGEHLLMASADSLPFVVEALLDDEERLRRIRTRAHERLKAWLPFALSVSVLRAAVVELLGQPVPAHASLGHTGSAGLSEPATAAAEESNVEIAAMRRELERARRELVEVRRALGRVQDAVESVGGAGSRVRIARETLAWSAITAPRVTVLLAARPGAEELHQTAESISRSRLRDVELVVVGSGLGNRPVRAVSGWLAEHPRLPARLVTLDVDRGLGPARNAGLDFARAPYCLILRPGELLYPRCLDVLAGTLDAMPDTAFVFPILEIVDPPGPAAETQDDHLANFLGWDPSRRGSRSEIRSPFLIRTDRLRELGGFTTDEGRSGVEDHALWREIADRSWRGQLTPEILARRTVSPSAQERLRTR